MAELHIPIIKAPGLKLLQSIKGVKCATNVPGVFRAIEQTRCLLFDESLKLQERREWFPYHPTWDEDFNTEIPYQVPRMEVPMHCNDHAKDAANLLVGVPSPCHHIAYT